jgi:phage portal protein BeeE
MAFASVRARIANGLKALAFSFPGGANSYGWNEWTSYVRILPGSDYDYKREAGDLWDNSVVRTGLKWKQDAFAEPKLIALRPDAKGKLQPCEGTNGEPHQLVQLLENPNEWYDGGILLAGITISLEVDGNAYLWKLYSSMGKLTGLAYVPHFFMEPITGGPQNAVVGYAYTVNGKRQIVPADQIVHLRDGLHPRNQHKGLSRLGAMLREICTVNECSTYSASLLRNAGVPSAMFAPDASVDGASDLTAAQADSINDRWRSKFTRDGRGSLFISSVPAKLTPLGFSPEQLALDKIYSIPVTAICASMNLDPMVLGYPSDQRTYSNFGEANLAAYLQCVVPSLRRIDRQLTRTLMPEILFATPYDVLGRDYDEVRAMQESQDARYARSTEGYKGGWLKRSEARSNAGYEFDKEDEYYFTDLTINRNEVFPPGEDSIYAPNADAEQTQAQQQDNQQEDNGEDKTPKNGKHAPQRIAA